MMLRRDAQGGHLRIVLNWTEELKQILAKGGVREPNGSRRLIADRTKRRQNS